MNILLTGDDGYNSIGTRVLISILKESHTLTVVGTTTQQSCVGGKLSLGGCAYVEKKLDGIKTFCVDGTPADCAEFAYAYFPSPFDCVISGINMGENVSTAIVSSGTVSAAKRALGLGVAPRGIAVSWESPPDFYYRGHDENEDISTYLKLPGQMVRDLFDQVFSNKYWGAELLNINFPKTNTKEYRFTHLSRSISACYPPAIIQKENNTFSYAVASTLQEEQDENSDVSVLHNGKISITPLMVDWTDRRIYERYK